MQRIERGLYNGILRQKKTELKSHVCSVEELGLIDRNGKFWQINDKFTREALLGQSYELLRLDESDLYIYRQFDLSKASIIVVDIVKCTEFDVVDFKSEEEIKEYFAEQQMFILANQIVFDFQKYGEESIIKESEI